MLGKLLKYEIKSMGRLLLPLYAVLLVTSVALGMIFQVQLSNNPLVNLILRRFQPIVIVIFVVIAILTGIVMAMLLIQRFYKNLLGQEGYLMFTLPVTTAQNIWSKALTSLIWIVLGIITGALCGLIMISLSMDLGDFLKQLSEVWKEAMYLIGDGRSVATAIMIVVTMLIGILQNIMMVYAGFAIGHQWNDHRILGSVIAYIAFMLIEIFIIQIPFVENVLDTLTSNSALGDMIWVSILEAVRCAIFYGITWFLLDKRLNLE